MDFLSSYCSAGSSFSKTVCAGAAGSSFDFPPCISINFYIRMLVVPRVCCRSSNPAFLFTDNPSNLPLIYWKESVSSLVESGCSLRVVSNCLNNSLCISTCCCRIDDVSGTADATSSRSSSNLSQYSPNSLYKSPMYSSYVSLSTISFWS